ncbi:L-rhamnose mutarotase [Muricauda sp. HICW]|uniref:L-rhamnose mutarotase n=1 Tax=Flagellimonas chongwuensis TaxID=2697365 RepID=A0A850ND59_9FLAO|nr:L-rhamnose mutarotase [Allomuricauda chongwuensis]NVN19081.1 L-rhamnose mutarotase [Allomuricauda chongwuensis]
MGDLKRYGLALDLVDDKESIATYEAYHKNVWPEVIESIKSSGIHHMEIYRAGNRLFMIMEVDDSFSFQRKKEADSKNPKVQEWEALMGEYQRAIPVAKPGDKWVVMDKIFDL